MKHVFILVLFVFLGACSLFSHDNGYVDADHGEALKIPDDLDQPDRSSALKIPAGSDEKIAPAQDSAPPRVVSSALTQRGKRSDAAFLKIQDQILKLVVNSSQQETKQKLPKAIELAGMDSDGLLDDQAKVKIKFLSKVKEKPRTGFWSNLFSSKQKQVDDPYTYLTLQVRKTSQTQSSIVVVGEQGGLRGDAIAEEALAALIAGFSAQK
ncbi:MAG: hypothetical protein ACWA5R_04765 [bacterium]